MINDSGTYTRTEPSSRPYPIFRQTAECQAVFYCSQTRSTSGGVYNTASMNRLPP